MLPMHARAQYEECESRRGSIKGTEPKPPSGPYSSRYERDRSLCLYYQRHENWEAAYLNRLINAEKSRLRRIKLRQKKLKHKNMG